MRSRCALGLMVMLAACGAPAADIADSTRVEPVTTQRATPRVTFAPTPAHVETGTASSTSTTRVERVAATTSTPTVPSESVPPATPGTQAEAPPSVPIDIDADQRAARAATLQLTDLATWTPSEEPPLDLGGSTAPSSECAYLEEFASATSATATASAAFVDPTTADEIANETVVHRDVASATAALSLIERSTTPDCLESILTGRGNGVSVELAIVDGVPTNERIATRPGDSSQSYVAYLTAIVAGDPIEVVVRLDFVRIGRAVSTTTSFGLNAVPAASSRAVAATTARLRDAFG